jgi:MFS family permease
MRSQFLPILALLTSTFFMLVGGGMAGMILPLRASLEGWSPTTIGWIGTGYAICFTAGCIVVPRLVRRVGHVRVYASLTTILAMSLLLHALAVHPLAWIVIRGAAGFALAGAYMVVESWLNEKVTNENRGMVFSVYMIVNMAGLIAGQYVVAFGDPALPYLFMIGCLFYCLALLPTSLSSAQSPRPLTQVSINVFELFRKSPAAVVGSFLAGLIGGNWNYLAPIYGKLIGLGSAGIATMLACAMLGGVVFQYPLGRVSDKVDRRYVMTFAGLVGVFVSLFMIFIGLESQWFIYAGMFFFGSVLFPIYSLNVAHANDMAEPEEFVRVSSGLLIIYGLGNMTGPQMGGRLMDFMGPSGFFVAMLFGFACYGGYSFWRTWRREAIAPEERPDFQPIAVQRLQTPETLQLDPRIEDVPEQERGQMA